MRWLVLLCALPLGCGDDLWPYGELDALIDRYERGELSRDELLAELAAIEDSGIPSELPSEIGRTTLLKARPEPYRITGDLSVASGAILVLEPGVEVVVAAERSIAVEGRLYAIGADSAPVRIRGGAGERFGDLVLEGGPNQLVMVELERGERPLVIAHDPGLRTLVEAARFDTWGDVAVDVVASGGLHIVGSRFGYQTDEAEVLGETVRARNSGFIAIEGSAFNYRIGYRDVIDLQDCVEGSWPLLRGNLFEGGEDDAIDLDTCSAVVIGNVIRNFRPRDLDVMVAGVNGGGVTGDRDSHPLVAGNVIDGCYHAIGFKNGATPVIVNNTIVNSNIGVTLYQAAPDEPPPAGVLVNNILWNNADWRTGEPQDVVLNGKWWPEYNQVDEVQATIDARYNITRYPGEGNVADDPLLELDQDGVPIPAAGSPALDSGLEELSFPGIAESTLTDALATDFRGAPRRHEGARFPGIDRGAVEASR